MPGAVTTGFLPHDTIRDRWVACDYDIKSHGTSQQTHRFVDQLDAATLDALYDRRNSALKHG